MKRTDFFIRLTTAVLFLAVLCYIGVYVYNALLHSYETMDAMRYTVEQTFPSQGYIVRSETVITDSGLVVLPIAREGEKVASGQAIIVEYMSSAALETASEIRELRLMIAHLESSSSAAAAESVRLSNVMDLSKAVQGGDLSRLDELAINIEASIFSGTSSQAVDLPAMKARLEMLEARSSGIRMIYAPESGTFSQVVDGFEHISPDALVDIMPAQLSALFASPSYVSSSGKLVTEFKWYYAALMDAADALRLSEGRQIALQFSGAFHALMDMQVERVSRRDGDECVVLFSSTRSIHELTQFRQLRADVIFGSVSGIRVPKEAIHLDDNGTIFIYLQTGVRAERVNVEILIESGDSYLVRDGAESGTALRVGSTIIVKANNLFDGKIVA